MGARIMAKATPEEFIEAWQQSSSVKEVAKRLNMPPKTVSSRASYYRKKKVPLKKMRSSGRGPLNWKKLAELARELAEESSVPTRVKCGKCGKSIGMAEAWWDGKQYLCKKCRRGK